MKRQIAMMVLVIVVGVAAFAATRAARWGNRPEPAAAIDSATQALLDWLNIPDAQRKQLHGLDPTFAADLKKLREDLADERSKLAETLEGNSATNDTIIARVEGVIAADNALQRRITRFLLSVRQHLTADQQRRLFSLCAEGVRQGPGWRWRGGRGPGGPGQR